VETYGWNVGTLKPESLQIMKAEHDKRVPRKISSKPGAFDYVLPKKKIFKKSTPQLLKVIKCT